MDLKINLKITAMEQRELLMNFMRSLKAKGLLDKNIHSSVVDVFIHSELPRLNINKNKRTLNH